MKNNTKEKVGIRGGTVGPRLPSQKAGWMRVPKMWRESELLRSRSDVGSEIEDGVGMELRQQVSHCSDDVAREKVDEHLQWSGWWR